jgi:hypothetical protein
MSWGDAERFHGSVGDNRGCNLTLICSQEALMGRIDIHGNDRLV